MSLRDPQKKSLKILNMILDDVELKKDQDLNGVLNTIRGYFPSCIDFERDFISLSFALATGVGKTRLIGAFITYLYAVKGIKNFFVVAPNLTIYNKLSTELRDSSNPKYVFKGVDCFSNSPPRIVTGENYKQAGYTQGLFQDCTINIFNIDKFNKDLGSIKKLSEYMGESYFNFLSSQKDLVVIMDESHHYRAAKGFAAINDLNPVLGLELTATPHVEKSGRAVPFRNVVYNYPLHEAIRDGFTKIPYAMTRRNISETTFSNNEHMDRIMLMDGIQNHEDVKAHLEVYAKNNDLPPVKPFVLVVCKDTDHADGVKSFIESNEFQGGKYRGKILVLHSGQTGSEKEENIQRLLKIEKYDDLIEIVIHVNILKEGWDVNNLYTLIPLRTAASKTLREQTIGRGLRLPYGKPTGDIVVDRLMITAHDRFDEIVREANDPNSLLRRDNIIYVEDCVKDIAVSVPSKIQTETSNILVEIEKSGIYTREQRDVMNSTFVHIGKILSSQSVEDLLEEKEIKEIFRMFPDQEMHIEAEELIKRHIEAVVVNTIEIPLTKIEAGEVEYIFQPFELDVSELNFGTIDEVQLHNLSDNTVQFELRSFDLPISDDPITAIATELRARPEIGDDCTDLLYDLITTFLKHLGKTVSDKNIPMAVMVHRKNIASAIFTQMKEHLLKNVTAQTEQMVGVSREIFEWNYTVKEDNSKNLLDYVEIKNIPKTLYSGFKKALHNQYMFESDAERKFAYVCDVDNQVLKWMRPAHRQFNLYYGANRYIPDFVVETADCVYLVEVKGNDKLFDPIVLAKRDRAVQYCNAVNDSAEKFKIKQWKYLFIPANDISISSSFEKLVEIGIQ